MKNPQSKSARRKARSAPPSGSALDRIVLAEGYPWANGTGPGYFEITMRHKAQGGINLPVNWPPALWSVDVAKYRLVLERVDAAPNAALSHASNNKKENI